MPTLSYDWNQVSALRRARMDDAETYAKRINEGVGFYDWLHIGEGLTEWRDAALELTGSQDTDTPAYRAAFAAAVPLYPQLAKIAKDKAERSHAIWMWENHDALEEWHAGLNEKQRRRWNHPRTVWNHSPLGRAAKDAQKATSELKSRPRAGQAAAIENATERLEGILDKAEQRIGPDLAEMFDLSPEHIEATVDNLIDIFGEDGARRLYGALGRRFAPAVEPDPAVTDTAFQQSLAKPKRKPRTKPLDDPTRPRNRGKENLAPASEPVVSQEDLTAIVAEIEALPRLPRTDGMAEISKIIERHATRLGVEGWDLFYRVDAHSRELEAKRPRRRSREEKAAADWEKLSEFYRNLGKTTGQQGAA
jgi:hypothetical protein